MRPPARFDRQQILLHSRLGRKQDNRMNVEIRNVYYMLYYCQGILICIKYRQPVLTGWICAWDFGGSSAWAWAWAQQPDADTQYRHNNNRWESWCPCYPNSTEATLCVFVPYGNIVHIFMFVTFSCSLDLTPVGLVNATRKLISMQWI